MMTRYTLTTFASFVALSLGNSVVYSASTFSPAPFINQACSNLCSKPVNRGIPVLADSAATHKGAEHQSTMWNWLSHSEGGELYRIIQSYINEDPGPDGSRAKYGNEINCWDISQLTHLNYAFYNTYTTTNFNDSLDCWDTSHITSMQETFTYTQSFNQDIGMWDVSSVENFSWMFGYATAFNQDISHWDASNAVDMRGMFYGARAFNQDISTWDISSVEKFSVMFADATAFNQNLCDWKPLPTKFLSAGSPTYRMFDGSGCEFNQLYVGHAVCQSCAPTCKELKNGIRKEDKKNKEKTQLLTELLAGIVDNSCGTDKWLKKHISELQSIIDIYKPPAPSPAPTPVSPCKSALDLEGCNNKCDEDFDVCKIAGLHSKKECKNKSTTCKDTCDAVPKCMCEDNDIIGMGTYWCEMNTNLNYVTPSVRESFCSDEHYKTKCLKTCGYCN